MRCGAGSFVMTGRMTISDHMSEEPSGAIQTVSVQAQPAVTPARRKITHNREKDMHSPVKEKRADAGHTSKIGLRASVQGSDRMIKNCKVKQTAERLPEHTQVSRMW